MINSITIQGRLTKDCELRYTQNKVPVASFTVACERDRKDTEGEKQVDFIDCTAWQGTAEFVNKYFHKGDLILLQGRLQSQHWTDKDGNNRTKWEVVANQVWFCGGSKRESGEQNSAPRTEPERKPKQETRREPARNNPEPVDYSDGFGELEDADSDLPF